MSEFVGCRSVGAPQGRPVGQSILMSVFRTNVVELLRHPGARRAATFEGSLDGLGAGGVVIPEGEPLRAEVVLESVPEGIVVRGRVDGRWEAECGRCLSPTGHDFGVSIHELFEVEAEEGETYPLDGDYLDLEPVLRDAVLLDLPRAPLCRDDCAGLCPQCGVDRNREQCACDTRVLDPRWDALGALTELD